MGKKKEGPSGGPMKTFKYGMPIYGLAWPEGPTFYMCGGGGHGIKNRLVCAEAQEGSLTDQTAEHLFGQDCPTRLTICPGAKSIVFAMGKGGIQRLDLDTRNRVPRFIPITGGVEEKLKAITMDAKALAFHPAGDLLALGGEDGSVAVYEWPSLKAKVDLSGKSRLSEEAIKDLDFVPRPAAAAAGPAGAAPGSGGPQAASSSSSSSSAGRALMVVLDNGSTVVVDVERAGAVLCKVQLAKGEEFKSDKVMLVSSDDRLLLHHLPPGMENATFSRVKCRAPEGGRATIACLMNNRSGCHVGLWELGEDGLLSMRTACKAADAPGACMDYSGDGSMVAVGTSEGDVALVGCRPHLRVIKRFPKAHMVFTTNITFSPDAAYVLSASADASATVNPTALPPPPDIKKILFLFIIFITIVLLCLLQAVRVLKQQGMTMEEIYAMVGLRPKEEL